MYSSIFNIFLADRDMISRVVRGLSSEFAGAAPLSVTMFKLISQSHEWDRRKSIRNTLMSLPTQFIGRNFMVIVTTKIMESVMEIARDLGMVNTFSQWLYVISDTTFTNNNISSVSSIITEGNNVAFVYSIVKTDESCVVSGSVITNQSCFSVSSFHLGWNRLSCS